ncbi:polyprenyl synthetase [Aureimonas endophytica]|uniref:Octaprenyl diphosphate synthase n=1 Tax=Aureimonas endophytica TaxID=2027858 RepID=A0A917E8U8_9HYPH|nr:polyprenyl synthetase family protein [Aureimonas endophytica]GGE14702.1 polyprenyl synthetase [Aureimonas endophytica]
MSLASPAREGRQTASIEAIVALTRADMEEVNRLILAMAGSNVELIPQIADHLISSGGKRLRPMLTIASALACGYAGEKGHVKLAASVEFMHTATLLHDDVVDESDLRRGKKTARMIWGNQASVLVGDFLLGQAFKMMVEVGSLTALDILSRASAVIAEGEVWQLAAAKKLTTTEADYLAVIEAKTAALFSAATEVGPVLAASGDEIRAAMRAYGLNLGRAFQLVDDVLDYRGTAKALGKNVGDDFREGKITLPVIIAHERGTPAERDFWRRALEENGSDDAALAEACRLLEKHGALEATVARARGYGEAAYRAASVLPRSEARDSLLDVVEFCIDRIN